MSNKTPVGQRGYYSHIKTKPKPIKKGFSKWFWVSIIILVIVAIVVFVLFIYYQIIIDSIMGFFQGIIDYFINLFTW